MVIRALLPEQVAAMEKADMENKTGVNKVQVGGAHYKHMRFETWDVIADWGLGYFDGNAVKYLSRWRHKGGIEDLRKAKHYIEKLIEMETSK